MKSIKWRSKPNPDATIDQHTVTVKDFGIIYFGELYITSRVPAPHDDEAGARIG